MTLIFLKTSIFSLVFVFFVCFVLLRFGQHREAFSQEHINHFAFFTACPISYHLFSCKIVYTNIFKTIICLTLSSCLCVDFSPRVAKCIHSAVCLFASFLLMTNLLICACHTNFCFSMAVL